jgi:serine/threonine-protein kinase RsbW
VKVLKQISAPATLEHLRRLVDTAADCARKQNLPTARVGDVELAVDEAVANVCRHAYGNDPGEVALSCAADEREFVVEITDRGRPFDLLSVPPPDLTQDVMEREPGGLGVFLIRKVMDRVEYRRENERNVLTLHVERIGGR